MKQVTFASRSVDVKKKRTRREVFPSEMGRVVPWAVPETLIEPRYPTSGRRGPPPMARPTILRIHFLPGVNCQ